MGSNAGGFDFSLVKRNAVLQAKGMMGAKAWKTGTTIAGVVYKARRGPRSLGARALPGARGSTRRLGAPFC